MGYESKDIELFNKGLISAADAEDIPDNAASAGSLDLDPNSTEGRLEGRHGETVLSNKTVEPGLTQNEYILNDDGTQDLVYITGDELHTNVDFLKTTGGTDTTLSTPPTNLTSLTKWNREVRVGATTPKMVGKVEGVGDYAGLFGGSAPSGLQFVDAIPDADFAMTLTAITESTLKGSLLSTTKYFYRWALEFDGYQVGPLNPLQAESDLNAHADGAMELGLEVQDYATVPMRGTAILIFRAESPNNKDAPESQYRFCLRQTLRSGTWGVSGIKRQLTTHDIGFTGQTYDDYAGISETATMDMPMYKLATVADNYLVVGRCTLTAVEDASHMLFRSKQGRPDMFDWVNDFLKLPTIPVQLASFGGRVYAFDAANIYRVNVNTMSVEDHLVGTGLCSDRAVLTTEFGMFFADANMCYMHDGKTLHPIGKAIKTAWKSFQNSTICVVYHAGLQSVLFLKPGTLATAYAYNLVNQRWDYMTFARTQDCAGVIEANDGSLYLPADPDTGPPYKLYKICDEGAYRKAWTWISKSFTMDDPSQWKRLYNIVIGTKVDTITATYSITSGTTWVASPPSKGTFAKTVIVKLVGSAETVSVAASFVSSVSILFRRMMGKR
jgi:hypothetical protein